MTTQQNEQIIGTPQSPQCFHSKWTTLGTSQSPQCSHSKRTTLETSQSPQCFYSKQTTLGTSQSPQCFHSKQTTLETSRSPSILDCKAENLTVSFEPYSATTYQCREPQGLSTITIGEVKEPSGYPSTDGQFSTPSENLTISLRAPTR